MKRKIIYNYIYIIDSSIVLFSISLLIILNITIFNKSYFINLLDRNNYYQELFKDIKLEMSYYTEQSGFKDDILDGIFTVEDIKRDIDKYVNNYYDGKVTEINVNNLKSNLNKKIDDYLDLNQFEIDDRYEIDLFVDKMSNIYISKIKLVSDKYSNKFKKLISISKISLFIMLILLIIAMIKNKFRNIDIILFINSFLDIGFYLYIYNKIDIKNILLFNKFISKVVINAINNILNKYIIIGIVYLLIGIVFSVIDKRKSI